MEEGNFMMRMEAMQALAAIGPGAAGGVPQLTVALGDENPLVVDRAAWALGKIGPAAAPAVPDLIRVSLGPDHRVTIAITLRKIGAGAVEAVPRLIEMVVMDGSYYAADALGAIGAAARDAVPSLAKVLADSKATVDLRWSAARALGNIGPSAREAVPALKAALAAGVESAREALEKIDAR